ncbi:MAG: hypothetical protein B0D96_06510 [Candidatus Sedimenticola endophacoides]|uniref:Poly(3-hydroxyalkanoate) polymerase subunit PhaE n=1 Tax=Candidatus Sedimenticola endophacoides TaxID=2548426 RepID=A0A657PVI0_9GAMM|nr:MAG: hypothetical protein B0D96_06510 [Candidatus Sedimenticola endophacoides]OQX40490.1 MAG: hypothetical protein B0D89_07605 [Candidatus Sedimenticola endophacoides]OQX43995.1 MAG: hypothetical protein B0D86_06590 [Candidatus Sedimenticola endophacoides]OQX45139.1 MAG: hypothetical protein B0D85_06055 [Candidatus Sedimenticola endophacoides]PUD99200.1 MAG: class III poly(R)-hydroxyalkanoic acid synthase subunit PhaE [Candidatus Sedimenticola endophacoides]
MSEHGFWDQDWMKVQTAYWAQWGEWARKATGGDTPAEAPWESAMRHWWQALAPGAPDAGGEFMQKMIDQGKMMFGFAERFNAELAGQAGGAQWGEVLNRAFAGLQKSFSGEAAKGDDALHRMMAFWEMPLDNWQRMVSSLSLTPGDLLRNMPHGDPQANIERFLSAPGLGYTREEQGQHQQMLLKVVAYQGALQDYARFFSGIGTQSVDRMRARLDKVGEAGETIESARALYDLWVGACEEVYSEQVMTAEYAELHGRLVNALMALKQQMAAMVDEGLGAMNMPTRKELRTLQTRMQENRREIKALKAELTRMRRELAERPAQPKAAAKAPRAKAARKKSVARNKTAAGKG